MNIKVEIDLFVVASTLGILLLFVHKLNIIVVWRIAFALSLFLFPFALIGVGCNSRCSGTSNRQHIVIILNGHIRNVLRTSRVIEITLVLAQS